MDQINGGESNYDATFTRHGSIVLMHPRSVEAREFIEEQIAEPKQFHGHALAIELRYAEDILMGAQQYGLRCEVA